MEFLNSPPELFFFSLFPVCHANTSPKAQCCYVGGGVKTANQTGKNKKGKLKEKRRIRKVNRRTRIKKGKTW
jgi:hypothetical protein